MARFILYIISILLLLLFLGMNWSNTSNINIWFGNSGQIKDVPICISFLFVFLLGVASVIPIVFKIIGYYRKKERDRYISTLSDNYQKQENAKSTSLYHKKNS